VLIKKYSRVDVMMRLLWYGFVFCIFPFCINVELGNHRALTWRERSTYNIRVNEVPTHDELGNDLLPLRDTLIC
jgi:hypothetical protein